MLLILVSLCGLISCVSQHKHLLVHLSCHSITKTKQGPFTKDLAWRRPSWCGVVRLFVSFSTLGPTEVFSTIIRVWSADGCCGLFRLCCRFVWGGYLWASRGSLSSPCVDDPIQPNELSCCVPRIDITIQPDEF